MRTPTHEIIIHFYLKSPLIIMFYTFGESKFIVEIIHAVQSNITMIKKRFFFFFLLILRNHLSVL